MDTLEGIYHQYLDFVFRICSRYTRNREESEDLTQEVFVKLIGRLETFRGEAEMRTWIYRIAANCCLDHLRKRKRENRLEGDYLDNMVVRNLQGAGDQVLARIELDRILGQMLPRMRRILFLTLAEGLSYAETAEVLGLTQAAVAKSVARFLKKTKGERPTRPGAESLSKWQSAARLRGG